MLFLVLPASEGGGLYWLGALLTVVSNVALGTSIVFYNSYMPLLVEGTPEVLAKRAEGGDAEKLQRLRSEYESEYSQKGMVRPCGRAREGRGTDRKEKKGWGWGSTLGGALLHQFFVGLFG